MGRITIDRTHESKTVEHKILDIGSNHADAYPDDRNIVRQGDASVQPIVEPTELGEVLKDLDNDSTDPTTKMSGMDMRARLHPMEISRILAIDTLVGYKFLTDRVLGLTRQKKRLSVSIQGQGRKERVEIVQGKREMEMKKGGIFQNFKGWLGGGGQQ